ncbi:MAG: F0F1 ATP synthase subunit delta [Candidatus Yanofskybacteria bacterium]|nr:F0F1 ATP synthase subunit delta [Candidatus Yanofskybacteria bacterium]
MRYSVNNYVGAFTQIIKEIPREKAINGFLRLLAKTGDIKHSKKILTAIHKKIINEDGGKWIDIEAAREPMPKREMLKNKFSKKDHINFIINPELVAGVRITVNGEEELNNTLRNKLNKLFK